MKQKPRRDRWVSYEQLATLAEAIRPELKGLPSKSRRQYARRLVRRVEKLHAERYTKRFGREVLVSVSAIEYLLPPDATTVSALEKSVDELVKKHAELKRQVNGHGARLRNLEDWRKLTGDYLEAVARLNGVKVAS